MLCMARKSYIGQCGLEDVDRLQEVEAYKPLLKGIELVTCSATPSSNSKMDTVLQALSLALCDVRDSTTQPNQRPINVLTAPPANGENRPCTGTVRALDSSIEEGLSCSLVTKGATVWQMRRGLKTDTRISPPRIIQN